MVFWVTRSKESLSFRVIKKLPKAADKRILRDQLVVLKNKDSRANYPKPLRRVLALVEVDGKERAWIAASGGGQDNQVADAAEVATEAGRCYFILAPCLKLRISTVLLFSLTR